MECKRCGTKNNPGDVKCSFCGAVLEEAITITMPIWKKCPVCGYTLSEDEKYCSYCGTAKDGEADENFEDDEKMSSGMKVFVKTMVVIVVLVLLFAASFFGVQSLF